MFASPQHLRHRHGCSDQPQSATPHEPPHPGLKTPAPQIRRQSRPVVVYRTSQSPQSSSPNLVHLGPRCGPSHDMCCRRRAATPMAAEAIRRNVPTHCPQRKLRGISQVGAASERERRSRVLYWFLCLGLHCSNAKKVCVCVCHDSDRKNSFEEVPTRKRPRAGTQSIPKHPSRRAGP